MKVSVLTVTYNHEKYIAQAIESVLLQKTDFDYEMVLGEDRSTDSTREIIQGYQEKYPDRVRLLPVEDKLGMSRNYIRTWKACRGEYIAFLDGDDYWTSEHKLQKQVDFLDSHPECSICFHRGALISVDGSVEPYIGPSENMNDILTLKDLLPGNFMPNCSVMFRNGLINELPEGYCDLGIPDWPIHILNARNGMIGYIKEVMTVWRQHPKSSWSSRPPTYMLEEQIKLYHYIKPYLDVKFHKIVKAGLSRCHRSMMLEYDKQGDWKNVKAQAALGLREYPFDRKLLIDLCKVYLRHWVPGLYERMNKAKRTIKG
ncbi:MAG TPA: glycosyltransferase [Armatimonadota bacterium]|nr:glycosyltransferase [Armatimonadota bacterium]